MAPYITLRNAALPSRMGSDTARISAVPVSFASSQSLRNFEKTSPAATPYAAPIDTTSSAPEADVAQPAVSTFDEARDSFKTGDYETALAKAGFSQSYTYFTWKNTKPELVEFVADRRRPTRAVLERAVAKGELSPDTDFDLLSDLLAGPFFAGIFGLLYFLFRRRKVA